MSELTPRQWKLYEYLKEQGDNWTTQFQVALDVKEYWFSDIPLTGFHDCAARHAMTNDIRAINESGIIQKIIISSGKGIKIANEKEFDKYIGIQINAAVRKLQRVKKLAEKGNRNGQMRIVLNTERDTVKAFIDSDKDVGERLKTARQTSGLTAKQVVKYLQMQGLKFDEPLLSKYENGYAVPTMRQAVALGEILCVSPEYILYGQIDETTDNTAEKAVASRQKGVI